MNLRDLSSSAKRRQFLEKEMHSSLAHIGRYSLDEAIAGTRNCENMIGAAQIPLGVAGPLKIKSLKFKTKSYYLPLATTEGALVASINRGSKAITASGGALADSYRVGATRGPVFKVADLVANDKLNDFLEDHFEELKKLAAATSGHLTLLKFFSRGLGRYRFVRFVFDTQDAMGMNMVTMATAALVGFIEAKTRAKCLSLAGNYDVDKKPAWLNVIEGRGIKVWAEVILTSKVLRQVLKTEARAMYETWYAKCILGSVMAGSMSFNAHFANVLAAIFAATGQDLGHVSEGSLGVTTTEIVDRDSLHVSVYLPDLMVGTVGGGTGLATQKEALSLLGLAGGDKGKNSERFAEVVGSAVLAGEISLLASLSAGTLAQAHQKLARGGKSW